MKELAGIVSGNSTMLSALDTYAWWIYGHYPPPVTGERLCCMHLIIRLRAAGVDVRERTKRDGIMQAARGGKAWLLLGSTSVGFWRDGLLLVRQRRVTRVFVYIHNASWRRIIASPAWRRMVGIERTCFVVLTEEIANQMRTAGLAAVVLRNTVTATELSGLRAPTNRRRLIWMAGVTEEKGFREAYAAFLILRGREREWVFDVYGSGMPAEPFPEARFHGVVQGERKRAAFAQGGLLLLPSRYVNETQPLCLLEAMSVGIPVVASYVGGIPEIVGTGDLAGGRCVSAPDAVRLAVAIGDVAEEYPRYAARALARYEALFSSRAFDRDLYRIVGLERDPV